MRLDPPACERRFLGGRVFLAGVVGSSTDWRRCSRRLLYEEPAPPITRPVYNIIVCAIGRAPCEDESDLIHRVAFQRPHTFTSTLQQRSTFGKWRLLVSASWLVRQTELAIFGFGDGMLSGYLEDARRAHRMLGLTCQEAVAPRVSDRTCGLRGPAFWRDLCHGCEARACGFPRSRRHDPDWLTLGGQGGCWIVPVSSKCREC